MVLVLDIAALARVGFYFSYYKNENAFFLNKKFLDKLLSTKSLLIEVVTATL